MESPLQYLSAGKQIEIGYIVMRIVDSSGGNKRNYGGEVAHFIFQLYFCDVR